MKDNQSLLAIDFKSLFEFANKNYGGDISLMTEEEKLRFIIKPESGK